MRGDFSRRTYRPNRHYSRVLLQQGRVVLDADWNEQAEIQLRAMRTMMRDLVGPHAGPEDALGFLVLEADQEQGKIALSVTNGLAEKETRIDGRYYVDGIMAEHVRSKAEPLLKVTTGFGEDEIDEDEKVLFVYLEVWERHLTWVEENKEFQQRTMREVALGGPDTASRSEIRWRIGSVLRDLPSDGSGGLSGRPRPTRPPTPVPGTSAPVPAPPRAEAEGDEGSGSSTLAQWVGDALASLVPTKGTLSAGLSTADIGDGDPCRDTAEPRYRGIENRLYRVEIHQAENPEDLESRPAFKWSRENGSVVYPIVTRGGLTSTDKGHLVVEVADLGRDARYHLRRGNIVELVTARSDEAGAAGPLCEVVGVDEIDRHVTLAPFEAPDPKQSIELKDWALLRRWDQTHKSQKEKGIDASLAAGAIEIDGPDNFVLEDGIVVSFELPEKSDPDDDSPGRYGFQVGDYWLIPARTIPADIEWPRDEKNKTSLPEQPHGIERHYAPLALVSTRNGELEVKDLRVVIKRVGRPM